MRWFGLLPYAFELLEHAHVPVYQLLIVAPAAQAPVMAAPLPTVDVPSMGVLQSLLASSCHSSASSSISHGTKVFFFPQPSALSYEVSITLACKLAQ